MDALYEFAGSLERLEAQFLAAGAYMPGLATELRIQADALADKYPDDVNGGRE